MYTVSRIRKFSMSLLIASSILFAVDTSCSHGGEAPSQPDVAKLSKVLELVLGKAPNVRASSELNAGAEAAYLLYGMKQMSDEDITQYLQKLWHVANTNRKTSLRLCILAVQFRVTSFDESAELATIYRVNNSYFSFSHAHELIRRGQYRAAQDCLRALKPGRQFSLAEFQALGALRDILVSSREIPAAADAANTIWRFYDSCPPLDLPYIANLLASSSFAYLHVGASDEIKADILLRRVDAVQSLLAQQDLIPVATQAIAYLSDVKSHISSIRNTVQQARLEMCEGAVEKSNASAASVRSIYPKWIEFRASSANIELANELLQKGQMHFLSR